MPGMDSRRWRGLSECGWVTLALLVAALAWDASGLDLAFAHLAGGADGFPWRDNWALAIVAHRSEEHTSELQSLV